MSMKFYTAKEVSQALDVSTRVIYRAISSNDLIGRKIGGKWRFTERMINQWVETPRLGPSKTTKEKSTDDEGER